MRGYSDNQVDVVVQLLLPATGYACDVGANDGLFNSNTLLFEEEGWTVLCIEPNPELAEAGRARRKLWVEAACGPADLERQSFLSFPTLHGTSASTSALRLPSGGVPYQNPLLDDYPSKEDFVPVRRLDRLLEEADFPRLDYLTIDVEGYEYEVLAGFSLERWQPLVLVIESIEDTFLPPPNYIRYERRLFDTIFLRTGAMPEQEIVVCLPTRGRVEALKACVDSFLATSTRATLAVYVDQDQVQEYMGAADWQAMAPRVRFTVGPQVGPAKSIARLASEYRGTHRIIGIATDDSLFLTPRWDEYVLRTIDGFPGRIGVVSPAHENGDFVSFPYVSREWLDVVGWYVHPDVYHFAWDTVLEMLGEATAIAYATDEQFRMSHLALPPEALPHHYGPDAESFINWCVTGRKAIVKRLKSAIHGALHPTGGGR